MMIVIMMIASYTDDDDRHHDDDRHSSTVYDAANFVPDGWTNKAILGVGCLSLWITGPGELGVPLVHPIHLVHMVQYQVKKVNQVA